MSVLKFFKKPEQKEKKETVFAKPYLIKGTSDNRLLMVKANRVHRFCFFDEIGRVRFENTGTILMQSVNGRVKVYKKPHAMTYHKELMRQNSRALYMGFMGCDSERLTDNMLDFEEEL